MKRHQDQPTLFDTTQLGTGFIPPSTSMAGSNYYLNTLPSGEALKDQGIEKALDHANQTHEIWSERAYGFLLEYLKSHGEFMTEDVRKASEGIVKEPPSLRAWGGIIVRAARAGLIKRVDFRNVKNARAHCTPATVWGKVK